MDDIRFDELIWLNRNKLVFMIEELEVKNAVLEKKLTEALNGTLLKRYNQEKEDALDKLKIAVEALKFYANEEIWLDQDLICYPIALDDEGKISIEALKKIEGPKF